MTIQASLAWRLGGGAERGACLAMTCQGPHPRVPRSSCRRPSAPAWPQPWRSFLRRVQYVLPMPPSSAPTAPDPPPRRPLKHLGRPGPQVHRSPLRLSAEAAASWVPLRHALRFLAPSAVWIRQWQIGAERCARRVQRRRRWCSMPSQRSGTSRAASRSLEMQEQTLQLGSSCQRRWPTGHGWTCGRYRDVPCSNGHWGTAAAAGSAGPRGVLDVPHALADPRVHIEGRLATAALAHLRAAAAPQMSYGGSVSILSLASHTSCARCSSRSKKDGPNVPISSLALQPSGRSAGSVVQNSLEGPGTSSLAAQLSGRGASSIPQNSPVGRPPSTV